MDLALALAAGMASSAGARFKQGEAGARKVAATSQQQPHEATNPFAQMNEHNARDFLFDVRRIVEATTSWKGKRRYSWLLSNCDEEDVLGHEALEE